MVITVECIYLLTFWWHCKYYSDRILTQFSHNIGSGDPGLTIGSDNVDMTKMRLVENKFISDRFS